MKYSVFLFIWLVAIPQLANTQSTKSDTIIAGTASSISSEASITFSGIIIDVTDEAPIVGATIQVENSSTGTITDAEGKFSIEIPSGKNVVLIKYLGYQDLSIYSELYEDISPTIGLAPSSVTLDQVVIKDYSEERNISSVISGVESLDIDALQQRSQLLGELDVLRSIQSLSGVTSTGDGASGFNVRGGNADENLILQDDGVIFNPTHTLGFFSLFHPDLIQSVQLYKGNQPADYGGRLSSVLQVDLREGDKEEFHLGGGIGAAASRLTFEGPIKKGSSSFIIGARASYMDYLLNLVKNVDVKNSKSFFYDVTAKADARLSKRTKVGFTGFISGDEFRFGREVNFDYATTTLGGYINHLVTDRWNVRLSANYTDYQSSLFDIQSVDASKFTNGVKNIRAYIRNYYTLNESASATFGVEYNSFNIAPGEIAPDGENSGVIPEILQSENGYAITPYAQLEWKPNESISVIGGIRYTAFTRNGPGTILEYEPDALRTPLNVISERQVAEGETLASYGGWEPRIGINLSTSSTSSIKASYNKGYQYLTQISNTASATPIALWHLADEYIEPISSDNVALGYFKNFADNAFEASVEVFGRRQYDIVDYKDFPDLLLNENLEQEIVTGTGRAYGVELNFKKKLAPFRYDINYTYSRSERQVVATPFQPAINQGNWYSSNFDRPHSLNLSSSIQLSDMTNLSFQFTYSTGRPITAPESSFQVDNIRSIPIYSQRNEYRIPDYHRLDVSYTIGPFSGKKKKSENRLVLSIYNLYGRRNAYSVFFRQRPSQSLRTVRIATLGSIFPSITYNFKF